MMLWNKVYSASPYLDDVGSDVCEEPVRVCCVRSVGLLQILVFCVLIRGSSWLAFDVAISTSSFGQLYSKVWHLQNSVLMMKDCKPVFRVSPVDIFLVDTRSPHRR
jgi:hypothetical protein